MFQNDIFEAFDNRQGLILVLLDQFAAFDTIDHSVLMSCLQRRFGITGIASAWTKSYLSGQSQSVVLSGNTSHSSNLPYGVPQGSVLGPVLFTFYMRPVGDMIRCHDLRFQLYADDIQVYICFIIADWQDKVAAVHMVEHCLAKIRDWMERIELS